jgi:hypothetical protein
MGPRSPPSEGRSSSENFLLDPDKLEIDDDVAVEEDLEAEEADLDEELLSAPDVAPLVKSFAVDAIHLEIIHGNSLL